MSATKLPRFCPKPLDLLRVRLPLLLLLVSVLASVEVGGDMEAKGLDWTLSSITATGRASGSRPTRPRSLQAAEAVPKTWSISNPGFESHRRHSTAPRMRRSRNQCGQTCSNGKNITCSITKRSSMCIHKEESATDFPNRPRNLAIQKMKEGKKMFFNITWRAPYDYSYKAVKGYELLVSRFGRGITNPDVDCYFIDLSSTDWAAVPNVHEVIYHVDCAWTWASNFHRVHVKIFSYPKLADKHEEKATEAWITPERIELKNPSLDWKPSIVPLVDRENHSVIITVSPAHHAVDYLQMCFTPVISNGCVGKIIPIESPENAYRYRVTELATNQSYYIYIRPFNKQDEEIDMWIHRQTPFYLPPWPEEPPKPAVTKASVGLEVVAVLVVIVLLLLLGLVAGCLLCRRGYLQKIWFLRLCFPQTAFHGPPIKVLQVYVKEGQIFPRLVKTHLELLRGYLNVDCLDSEDLRQQHSMEVWLEQADTTLVYLSPHLVHHLLQAQDPALRRDAAARNPLVARKVEHIWRLAALHHGLHRNNNNGNNNARPPVIFILPDCWSSDFSLELSQVGAFRQVPRFHLTSPPEPLLSAVRGCRHSALTMYLSRSEHTQDISNTLRTLVGAIQASQDQYTSTTTTTSNGSSNGRVCMNGHAGGDCDLALLESNGHVGTGTVAGRLGHPHRTDSGFSSSAADAQRGGSNSSSEPPSHRLEQGGGEEEDTETDPMIQDGMGNLSASQMSMVFLPPESVGGDEDSVVILNDFRRLNARADWSS